MDMKIVNFLVYFEEKVMPSLLDTDIYQGYLDEMDNILGVDNSFGMTDKGNFRMIRQRGWKEHSKYYIEKFLKNYGQYLKELDDDIEYCQMRMRQEKKII